MNPESIPMSLSPAEHRIITALRDMPESPLRERLYQLLNELASFARNPRCPELQPDGVPCENPEADCDTCQVVLAMLDRLGRKVPASRA